MTGTGDGFAEWSEPEELSAREVFYIRHAENIRRWAALEKEVREGANRFLTGLAEEVEQRGVIPGLAERDVQIDIQLGGDWLGFGLSRTQWHASEVSVRMEWYAKDVSFDGGSAPYVGVRLNGPSFEDSATRGAFTKGLQAYRTATSSRSTARWSTLRRIPVDQGLVRHDSVDLVGYRTRLLAALVEEWEGVAGIIDTILASLVVPDGVSR